MVRVVLLISTLCLLCCSDADTLGDEPPVEVVIQGVPTWENGIGELVSLKCGYCHAYPLTDLSPNDIVPDLDLNTYATRIVDGRVIRGGDSIGRWIFEGILDKPVTVFADTSEPRRMPLEQGTPVTEREKAFLELWSNQGSLLNDQPPTPVGDPDQGLIPYFDACASCHSGGQGIELSNGQFLGSPYRREAVTIPKIKSMWLTKWDPENPLSDEAAANIQAYIFVLLDSLADNGTP